MIFERRAYTLRPGAAPLFWRAQKELNSTGSYADVIAAHNYCYFETLAGEADQIVQLNRYDSLDQWKALGEHIARTSTGEYFAAARPLLLRQENSFFVPAPVQGLTQPFSGDISKADGGDESANGMGSLCVAESLLDLLPGSVPLYWEAYRRYLADVPDNAGYHLIFAHSAIVGTLNRVLLHRWFESPSEANEYQRRMDRDEYWGRLAEACRPLVVHSRTTYLRPAPIPSLRSLFAGAGVSRDG